MKIMLVKFGSWHQIYFSAGILQSFSLYVIWVLFYVVLFLLGCGVYLVLAVFWFRPGKKKDSILSSNQTTKVFLFNIFQQVFFKLWILCDLGVVSMSFVHFGMWGFTVFWLCTVVRSCVLLLLILFPSLGNCEVVGYA